jgi:hypothetical protein
MNPKQCHAAAMLAVPTFLSPRNQSPRMQTLRHSSTCTVVAPFTSSEKREQTRAQTSTLSNFREIPRARNLKSGGIPHE